MQKTTIKLIVSNFVASLALMMSIGTASAATQVITSSDLEPTSKLQAYLDDTWFLYNDENDTIDSSLGSFVVGPTTTPLGSGSLEIDVTGTQRRNIATYQFHGTPLAEITDLKFSTYNPIAGNGGGSNRSGYLQFNVDFDGSDTWQRRLVFVPADNGAVLPDSWQEWDALQGGTALWKYSGPTWPGTTLSGFTARTWDDILSSYPGVRVRVSDSFMGIRVGEPYANGYTENIDAFKFGTVSGTTTFDFEPSLSPTSKDDCKNNAWINFNTPSFKNQGMCVSYMVSGK